MQHAAACYLVGVTVVAVALCIVSLRSLQQVDASHERQAHQATVYACGAILWPWLWALLVGWDVAETTPLALIGLAWAPFLLTLDMLWIGNRAEDRPQQALSYDANAISSLTFALGGIFVSNIGRSFARAASPMLSACIFLVCAFVLPSFSVRPGSVGAASMQAVQKVSLSFCVGLLMSAVAINLQGTAIKFGGGRGDKLALSLHAGDTVPDEIK